jgi:hypothetical protein
MQYSHKFEIQNYISDNLKSKLNMFDPFIRI